MVDGNALGWVRRPYVLPPFNGLAASSRARARLEGGKLYHQIILVSSHAISSAELMLGNDWIINLTADQLKFLERYKKQWEEDYVYVLPLSDVSMSTFRSEVLSGFNTTPNMDIELAVTYGAIGATPTCRAIAVMSDYDMRDPSALFRPRIRSVQLKGGTTGDLELTDVHLRKDGTEWIRRIHFHGGASDRITKLKVLRDDQLLGEIYRADMRFLLKQHDRAPQDEYFHFDPIMAGFAEEMFNTGHMRGLKFVVTLDGTVTSIPAIIESVEQLPNPAG